MAVEQVPASISVAALTPALRDALPDELAPCAPGLAALLADVAAGRLAPQRVGRRLDAEPRLRAALRALAGRQLAADQALVSFGSGNQFGDISIGDVVAGDKITLSLALPASRLSPRDLRNRRAMLARLRAIWIDGLLASTFAEIGRASLSLTVVPGAVERPLDAQMQELAAGGGPLPARASVVDAFDASGGALLVLGAPGAGKSVLLAELAGALIARAEADESQPIPVILPLASWAARRPPLGQWVVDELRGQYDVPRDVGAAWRDSDALLLLLDGLDEVDADHRAGCIAAINAFRAGSFAPLAVVSRSAEYRAAGVALRLGLAVAVQPLDARGVEALLAGAGGRARAVRDAIAADADLEALVRSPLMLAVMLRAFEGEAGRASLAAPPCPHCGAQPRLAARFCPGCAAPLPRDIGALRTGLIAAYVEQVFRRRGAALALPRERLERGLIVLARRMLAAGQVTFHLEDLQPGWLPGPGAVRAYAMIDRLGGALLAILVCLAFIGPVSLLVGAAIGPGDPWVYYALLGLVFGGTSVAATGRTERRVVLDTLRGMAVGLPLGLTSGAIAYLADPSRRELFDVSGLSPALGVIASAGSLGLSLTLAGGLYGMLTGPPGLGPRRVALVERVRWSWRHAVMSIPAGVGIGVGIGAIFGLAIGLAAVALTLVSRIDIQDFGGPAGASLAMLLLVFILVCVLGMVLVGSAFGLIGGLTAALRAGVVTPLLAPGEGLRRSARSALLGGLSFAGVSGACIMAILQLGALILSGAGRPQVLGLNVMLYSVTVFAVQGGVIGLLGFGGYTVLSHIALRLVLWRVGLLPWRIERMLEEAAERALLRRVGGGYAFPHRVFLEHFAARRAGAADEAGGAQKE